MSFFVVGRFGSDWGVIAVVAPGVASVDIVEVGGSVVVLLPFLSMVVLLFVAPDVVVGCGVISGGDSGVIGGDGGVIGGAGFVVLLTDAAIAAITDADVALAASVHQCIFIS